MAEITPPIVPEPVARIGAGVLGLIALVTLGTLANELMAASAAGEPVPSDAITVTLPVFGTTLVGAIWCTWMVASWNALRMKREDQLENDIAALTKKLASLDRTKEDKHE